MLGNITAAVTMLRVRESDGAAAAIPLRQARTRQPKLLMLLSLLLLMLLMLLLLLL